MNIFIIYCWHTAIKWVYQVQSLIEPPGLPVKFLAVIMPVDGSTSFALNRWALLRGDAVHEMILRLYDIRSIFNLSQHRCSLIKE